MRSFLIVLWTVFALIACENKSTNHDQSNKEFLNDSIPLYSGIIENFIQEMKEEYDTNYTDKIWGHHSELRDLLIGSRIDNFLFKDINGRELYLYTIEKPMVLEATASWCGPCKASVPVINELSSDYRTKLQFVLISHDEREKAAKYAQKYDPNIVFIPSDVELDAMQAVKVKASEFKLLFPFPTAFFIDENKIIKNIKTGGVMPGTFPMGSDTLVIEKEDAYQKNYDLLNNGILEII